MLTGAGPGSGGLRRPAWRAGGTGRCWETCWTGETSAGGEGKCTVPSSQGTSHPKTQLGEGLPHIPIPANLGHRGPGGHSIQTGVPGWEGGQETPLRAPSLLGGQAA